MNVTVIGSGGFEPRPGRETACILINGAVLVDTGWSSVFRLKAEGRDPCGLTTVFLTHLHGDHYLGLPGVLFYMGVRRGRFVDAPLPVTLAGPAEGLAEFARRVERFLRWDTFPELRLDLKVRALRSGDTVEDDEILARAFALSHTTTLKTPRSIASLGYRFTEKSSGASCVVAWDTSRCPAIAEAAQGADLLFHDIGHSTPAEAAEVAKAASVGRLLLIHTNSSGEAELAEARRVFPRTDLAREGQTLTIGDAAAGGPDKGQP